MKVARVDRPILVNGFQGGGSNILVNILSSHPDACWVGQETQRLFHEKELSPAPDFFSLGNLDPRPIPDDFADRLHATIAKNHQAMDEDPVFRFVSEGVPYGPGELASTRVILKNLNGLNFLDRYFHTVFTDAVSLFLVRNPVVLYESFKRHKRTKSRRQFARLYNLVVKEMLQRTSEEESAMIIRFEDLMKHPIESMERLLNFTGLGTAAMGRLRLATKPHYISASERSKGRHSDWIDQARFHDIADPNIDRYQLDNLTGSESHSIATATKHAAESLGYDLSVFKRQWFFSRLRTR